MQIDLEQPVRLTDSGYVPDTFISGLGLVENLGGGCFRFTFYAKQSIDGREELLVVAKLVAPMEAVPPAIIMAAKGIGLSMAVNGFLPRPGLN